VITQLLVQFRDHPVACTILMLVISMFRGHPVACTVSMFRDHPVACTVSLLVIWVFCDHPFWYSCFNVSQTCSEEPRWHRVAGDSYCRNTSVVAQITRKSLWTRSVTVTALVLYGTSPSCYHLVLSLSVGECIRSELYLHLRVFFFKFSLLLFRLTFRIYADAYAGFLGGS
jgi:hypothetical protein